MWLLADEPWYREPDWAWLSATGVALVVFLVRILRGRLRPHRVTMADFWWTHDAGREVTGADPMGAAAGYTTTLRVQVRGRQIHGERTLTNLTLGEKPPPWQPWRAVGWHRKPTRLDLVGEDVDNVRKDGLVLGDRDTPPITCLIVERGQSGRFIVGRRWRVVPWAGPARGHERRPKRVKLDR